MWKKTKRMRTGMEEEDEEEAGEDEEEADLVRVSQVPVDFQNVSSLQVGVAVVQTCTTTPTLTSQHSPLTGTFTS